MILSLPQAVIFDLDGLILDSEAVAFKVWKRMCSEQGLELSEEQYREGVGSTESLVARLTKDFGAKISTDLLLKRRPEAWKEILQEMGIPQKPGFQELLHFLKRKGIPCVLASSTERALVEQRLTAGGIQASAFVNIFCGDEVPQKKPAPDLYLNAVASLSLLPEQCLALEDSEHGALSAIAAGVPVIIIPDLGTIPEAVAKRAAQVLGSLHEVEQLLASLC